MSSLRQRLKRPQALQQLLRIRLNPLVLGALLAAALVFLAMSAGFAVAFNLRIWREEQEE